MKHVVIGTAGHVDHGKTQLVRALTGVDTDRLAEEKRRGVTIEAGFARLDFSDGTYAGVVDVPGHEKFIKNMLAGAGGIDLALLVVAADEGVMPQTVEHLAILQLLGVQDGLIAVTKCDLVEEEWLEMVKAEITARVRGTFLEGKEICAVSARTGEGVEQLRNALHTLAARAREKSRRAPYYLPIDRVFSVDGFGTVVTGTLWSGMLPAGGETALYPNGRRCRVRGLQVHGKEVKTACAGQRVAVNLAGIGKETIARGDVLAQPDSLCDTMMLDVRLENLRTSRREIKSGSRLHFHHGSAAHLAKAVLLDRDTLLPGENCYAQLRFTEPLAVRRGDRFIVRFYSPLETVGGGVILDEQARRHRRNDARVLAVLAVRESGSEEERLIQAVRERGASPISLRELSAHLEKDADTLEKELSDLCVRGVLFASATGYLASETLDALWVRCEEMLARYHREHPLHAGMRSAELRQKLLSGMEPECAEDVVACFVREGKLKVVEEQIALAEFSVHLTKRQRAIRERLLAYYRETGFETEEIERVYAQFAPGERADCRQVVESLVSEGELLLLAPRLYLGRKARDKACGVLRAWFSGHDELTLACFRDELGTSRRCALLVLEYFDRTGVLKKEGDLRRRGTAFCRIDGQDG